jgi:hypothetical protein
MERYTTVIENGILSLESGEDRLGVGEMDVIVDLIGGETYTISYDSKYSQNVDWLDLEDDGTYSFAVRETIGDMDFPETFVSELAAREAEDVPSKRARFFAESMQKSWDVKGNLDDEENPFN